MQYTSPPIAPAPVPTEAIAVARAAVSAIAKKPEWSARFKKIHSAKGEFCKAAACVDSSGAPDSPLQLALVVAGEKFAANPTPATIRAAFDALCARHLAKELGADFYSHFIYPAGKQFDTALTDACREIVEAARPVLEAQHEAKAKALRECAAAAGLDLASELAAADARFQDILRGLDELHGEHIENSGSFLANLGLPTA